MRKIRLAVVLVVASIAGVLFAAAQPESILAGDAASYRARMAQMFSGKIPYWDFDFEHLPGSIVPMAAAWLLGGSASLQAFAFALAAVSLLLLMVSSWLLVDLEDGVGAGLATRWAIAVVPLLPFLLFRNDSWSVLLAIAAFWLAIRQAKGLGGTTFGWLGILSKLWPGTWAGIEWWRGHRVRALLTVVLVGAVAILLRSDPVLRVQRPVGVHTETLAGSVLGLMRALGNVSVGLQQTSALYLEAPWWAHLINVVPAMSVGLVALTVLSRPFSWSRAWLLMGVLTGALMLASPLLSTQYMAWITPFASVRRRPWLLLLGVNVLSLLVITTWAAGLRGEGSWFLLVLVRNLAFVALLGWMTAILVSASAVQRSSASSDEIG